MLTGFRNEFFKILDIMGTIADLSPGWLWRCQSGRMRRLGIVDQRYRIQWRAPDNWVVSPQF